MIRGTFVNLRLRNKMVPGTEGVGIHSPSARRRTAEHLRGVTEISLRQRPIDCYRRG
ncbi:hypothetical protein CVS29_09655 [Arthrobacter psychrochitiniphilus]|uniref:Uncharacterized protein n=1 Tax=Arthrobacter psychrochitiniphilus TaxID=291045 RepID=A0A2V3DTA5_9MICC|nr:hypothetical protein CVS29_09655 [Arthrobacter psychrochitiniphilus]